MTVRLHTNTTVPVNYGSNTANIFDTYQFPKSQRRITRTNSVAKIAYVYKKHLFK